MEWDPSICSRDLVASGEPWTRKSFLQVASQLAKTRVNVLIDGVLPGPIFYLENRSIRDYREDCLIAQNAKVLREEPKDSALLDIKP